MKSNRVASRLIQFALLLGGLFGVAWCHHQQNLGPAKNEILIRVLLHEVDLHQTLPFEITGPWTCRSSNDQPLHEGNGFDGIIKLEVTGLTIGPWVFHQSEVQLQTAGDDALRLNHHGYQGRIIFQTQRPSPSGIPSKLLCFLELPLEEYVLGVVCGEMPTSAKNIQAALEAQAIATRSYAIYRIQESRPWLYADTRDQRFYGTDFETKAARLAVQQTASLILADPDGWVPGWFHSQCGGHTANAFDAGFLRTSRPCLEGIADPDCAQSRGWTHKVEAKTLDAFAAERGIGRWIRHLEPDQKDAAGRWTKVLVEGSRAEGLFTGEAMRSTFGTPSQAWQSLRTESDGGLIITGSGFGHGVGLCQQGALRLARQGNSAAEILDFYYPDTFLKAVPQLDTTLP